MSHQQAKLKWSTKVRLVILSSGICLAGNLHYGFATTYLNVPVDEFKVYLNNSMAKRNTVMAEHMYNWIWNLLLHIWFIGFFSGIWLSPPLNDRLGRKVSYIIMIGISVFTSICRFLAIKFYLLELLFFARFISAILSAVSIQTQMLFLQEFPPSAYRGFTSFLSGTYFAIAAFISMLLGNKAIWGKDLDYLTAYALVASIISFIFVLFIHDTPKYLWLNKQDKKAAIKSIIFYQGKSVNPVDFLDEISKEAVKKSENSVSIYEIFSTPHLKKAIILSLAALQITVSFWSIMLSSTQFLDDVNIEKSISEWSSTGMTLVYVIGTVVGTLIIERPNVIFAALQSVNEGFKYGCLGCFIAYGFTFGAGIGPVSRILATELVSQRYRSIVQAICLAVNQIMVIATSFAVLPLFSVIHSYGFLILYVVPSIISLVFLYMYLPETKGRPIYEIVEELKTPWTGCRSNRQRRTTITSEDVLNLKF